MKTAPHIKICGITDSQTAKQTAQLGADYIGIMCHPDSKRYVTAKQAIKVSTAVRAGGAHAVAVCVNHSAQEMLHICQALSLNIVQLHGHTSRSQHQHLPKETSRIYVLHVDYQGNIVNAEDEVLKYLEPQRDFLLFDGVHGGSGHVIPTHNLHGAAAGMRYFLAGGLTADNVAQAISSVDAYGVDISSGVESSSGKKDLKKIKAFIAAAQPQAFTHEY